MKIITSNSVKKTTTKTKPKIKTKPRANIKISLVYCKLSNFSIIIFQNEILFWNLSNDHKRFIWKHKYKYCTMIFKYCTMIYKYYTMMEKLKNIKNESTNNSSTNPL